MRENRERSVQFVLQEQRELDYGPYERLWDALLLNDYPSGLDYLMLDNCVFCGRAVSLRWVGSVTLCHSVYPEFEVEKARDAVRGLKPETVSEVVTKLVTARRRRMHAHPDWSAKLAIWTNRTNRVERRALALCKRSEEDEVGVVEDSASSSVVACASAS